MDYKTMLNDLVAGKRQTIEVDESNFFAFNQAWKAFNLRKQIVGEAQINGHVIYRFSESDNK